MEAVNTKTTEKLGVDIFDTMRKESAGIGLSDEDAYLAWKTGLNIIQKQEASNASKTHIRVYLRADHLGFVYKEIIKKDAGRTPESVEKDPDFVMWLDHEWKELK